MVDIFIILAAAVFTAAFTLQSVGTIKENSAMKKTTRPFLFIGLALFYVLSIAQYIPDSIRLLINGSAAILYAFAGTMLFTFKGRRPFFYGSLAAFFLSLASQISVTWASFKLYAFPIWISVLVCLILVFSAAAVFMIFIKSAKTSIIFAYVVSVLLLSVYIYTSLLTLAGEPGLYSVLMFSGSLLAAATVVMQIKKEVEETSSLFKFASLATGTSALTAFALGCVFMQAL